MTDKELGNFLKKVEPEPNSGCWLWSGSAGIWGYGRFRYVGKLGAIKDGLAHRVSYEHWRGPIPDGLTIDHLCRIPGCVNPQHLEAVTMRENTMRGNTIAAQNSRKTHCMRGHPLFGENLYIAPCGDGTKRHCKTCGRMASRAYEARKRAKECL